jgi:2-polyprenyl-3-methyl-5-hydroxy-6-metoxy-1,4-benzoquinol methylase
LGEIQSKGAQFTAQAPTIAFNPQFPRRFALMLTFDTLKEHGIAAEASVWTFSKPGRTSAWSPTIAQTLGCPTLPRRITVRCQGTSIRVDCFSERQSFTAWWQGAPHELIDALWQCHYGNVLVQTAQADWQALRSARHANHVTVKRMAASRSLWTDVAADAAAQHVMTPDDRLRFHEAFDMLTHDRRLKVGMADKARQVDRLVDRAFALDVIRQSVAGSTLRLVDAGCGKAYLSIALAMALQRRHIDVCLHGIDGNEHVVAQAQRVAQSVGLRNATFTCASIADCRAQPTDIFVALHACDTASDDAIRLALASNAQALLVAPCCHKAIQRQLRVDRVPEAVRPLLRDGIQRERLGDLVTDAIRKEYIRCHGYEVGLEEFVALEHTGKNVLICAERKNDVTTPSLHTVVAFCSQWGVTSCLLPMH